MQDGMMTTKLLMTNSDITTKTSELLNRSECKVGSDCKYLPYFHEDNSQIGICVISCET